MLVWGGSHRDVAPYGFGGGGRYIPGSAADLDGDGTACAGDCDDTDDQVWGTPGEVGDLDFAADTETILWTMPSILGGTAVAYDTLRTLTSSDFVGGICVETLDGSDTAAADPAIPPPGSVFSYLVRANNGCPGSMGHGTLGNSSSGAARAGRACP